MWWAFSNLDLDQSHSANGWWFFVKEISWQGLVITTYLELLVSLWTPTGFGNIGMVRMLRLVSLLPLTSTYMCWPVLTPQSVGNGSLARTMNWSSLQSPDEGGPSRKSTRSSLSWHTGFLQSWLTVRSHCDVVFDKAAGYRGEVNSNWTSAVLVPQETVLVTIV